MSEVVDTVESMQWWRVVREHGIVEGAIALLALAVYAWQRVARWLES